MIDKREIAEAELIRQYDLDIMKANQDFQIAAFRYQPNEHPSIKERNERVAVAHSKWRVVIDQLTADFVRAMSELNI